MRKVLKYLGLLAMIPLFTVGLTIGFSDDAYAKNIGTVDDGAGDHRFGSATQNSMPGSAKSTDQGNGGKRFGATTAYMVCGDRLCSEPAADVEAKIVKRVATPELSGPFFKEIDVQKASADSEDLFKAIYTVYAGDKDVTYIKLLVKSDKDSWITTIGGISEMASSPMTVLLKASDPSSISAEILDWKYNE